MNLHIMHKNKYYTCIEIRCDIFGDFGNIWGTQIVLLDKYYKMLSPF